MRRKDKEIIERNVIDSIIARADVCRLALSGDNNPYLVPLCFGYDGTCLYFHSAGAGRKIDMLRRNPAVCFEMTVDCKPVEGARSCNWTMRFMSVIGFGRVSFIEDADEKRRALGIIFSHYSDAPFAADEPIIEKTLVFRVDITDISGKKSGY